MNWKGGEGCRCLIVDRNIHFHSRIGLRNASLYGLISNDVELGRHLQTHIHMAAQRILEVLERVSSHRRCVLYYQRGWRKL